MVEFATLLYPQPGTLHPVSDEEVRNRQSRPTQAYILDVADMTGEHYTPVFNGSVKKETYPKPNDPRNISVPKPATKAKFARYIYPLADHLIANASWYAFGRSPRDIAEAFAERATKEPWLLFADISRMDGNTSRRSRVLERICAMRAFHHSHHQELCDAMDEQIAVRAYTETGVEYATGYSRGSGSMETAEANSKNTAFIAYHAWRNTVKEDGTLHTPAEAYAKLYLYGGDDSADGPLDPAVLTRAANDMGFQVDVELVRRGDRGCNFLNRWFSPRVWYGSPSSMCNPLRAAAKFFVGPSSVAADPLPRFGERCSGYALTDMNTPVIGDLAFAGTRMLGHSLGTLTPYYGQFQSDDNWPNDDEDGWMYVELMHHIPDFDYDKFATALLRAVETGDPNQLLQLPLCTTPAEVAVPKSSSIIGDRVYEVIEKAVEVADDVGDDDYMSAEDEEVHVAEAAVPRVKDGVKASPCIHKVPGKCPCTWSVPARQDDEADGPYRSRLKEWTDKRNKAARNVARLFKVKFDNFTLAEAEAMALMAKRRRPAH